jgi:hypothetical protein
MEHAAYADCSYAQLLSHRFHAPSHQNTIVAAMQWRIQGAPLKPHFAFKLLYN